MGRSLKASPRRERKNLSEMAFGQEAITTRGASHRPVSLFYMGQYSYVASPPPAGNKLCRFKKLYERLMCGPPGDASGESKPGYVIQVGGLASPWR